jgi:dihydroorotate dehydrogenase (NAD+) catalytic subunit
VWQPTWERPKKEALVDEQSLAVSLCGRTLATPLILASGVAGENIDWLVDAARAGAGAVVSKSISVEPRAGHVEPTVIEWEHGLINAVGLRNSGAAVVAGQIAELKRRLARTGAPVIASVFAETVAGFAEVAGMIAGAAPDMIEVNISCPNVEAEFGRPFAADAASAAAVTRAVKGAVSVPVIVKLSPNVNDIAAIACAVEEAGADAICAINSLTGMVIDIASGRPALANRTGGVTGGAIRPLAVRCVYEITRAVKIPVIGLGGVERGRDIVELVMAGATAVGVGSAVYVRGPGVFSELLLQLVDCMDEHGYTSLDELRGLAHRR